MPKPTKEEKQKETKQEENDQAINDTIEWLENYIDEDPMSEAADQAQRLIERLEKILDE